MTRHRLLAVLIVMILASGCAPWALWRGWNEVRFENGQPTKVATRVVTDSTGGEGLTLVEASINGRHNGWFVLDTGASVAILDDEIARSAGLSNQGFIGIGCGLQASVQRGSSFQLGPFMAKDPVFVVLDIDAFTQDIDADIKVAGFVGHAVLQHAVVTIDFDSVGDRVYVEDPSTFEPPANDWYDIRIIDDGPVVEGNVAGGKRGLFFLDTGKSGTVSLSVPYIERHNLLEGRKLKRVENRRVCGISEEWEGRLDWLSFTEHEVTNPTVRFRIPGTEGGDADRAADAVVGRELLKHFEITFDYPNRRVRLVRDEGRSTSIEPSSPHEEK